MTSGLVKEKNLEKQFEKQMGCMAGFLQIFDRHHILSGKSLHSAKRLPPSPVGDTTTDTEKSASGSPAVSGYLGKPMQPQTVLSAPSPQAPKKKPVTELRSPLAPSADLPQKSPLPLPIFQSKDVIRSSWKFYKETPRLSLDSRATTDAKGGLHPKSVANQSDSLVDDATEGCQQHRSPSVIARLMGLEPLPDSPEKTPALLRSASESRVSRDLFQFRLISDGCYAHSKQQIQSHSGHFSNGVKDNPSVDGRYADSGNNSLKKHAKAEECEGFKGGYVSSSSPWKALQPRKSFFDSGDTLPEPEPTVTIYGEIEKRIRKRGIDETSKDLETLKQILEALQLKGLLHSNSPSQHRHRNFVYDDSPIFQMKPSRSSSPSPINGRLGNGNDFLPSNTRNQPRGVRRIYSRTAETSTSPSPRRERNMPCPSPTIQSRSNSAVKYRPLNVETQRRANEPPENRKSSPVHSPKLSTRKTGPIRPDRTRKSKKTTSDIHVKEKITTVVVTEDEHSSISGSSITTSSDAEMSKAEEYKEGKSLLERCDRLLHSIAEIAATDMQPSPVSVLDSSFYKDESFTPSPVTTKRNVDFRDEYGELEGEISSPVVSPIKSRFLETPHDCDFTYVSDILRASSYLPDGSDIFLVLENQQYYNTSKVSRLQRKLIFDTVDEIMEWSKQLPPWKVVSSGSHDPTPPLDKVWTEFQSIREHEHGVAEDLFEAICGVLKKDLAGEGWQDWPIETSEMVLDIERLVFKDMVCEMIGDPSALGCRGSSSSCRRKLVF